MIENNYIEQINKIPPVEANDNEQELFNVTLKGNLNNTSRLDVKLKSLK